MPLFSKSSTTSGTTNSSGIGSSDSTTKAKPSAATTPNGAGGGGGGAGGDGTRPKSADFAEGANLNRDTSDIFSGTFSVNEGSSTGGSRMSSSFNQSSSYNRTFERKVLEESTPTVTTRMFTSSPLNTIKSTLGSGFPSDLGLGTGSFVQPHNYQFGTATSGSFQSSDDSLSATMDCAAFAPEDLKVPFLLNFVLV
ncbi:hypothetical protein GPALN_014714 [Globodera pallida]|nr:hypothetical protein GPALN_014714 [Globodera pallida]